MFEHLSRYFITDSKCTYIYQMKIELAINIPPTTAPNDEKANSGQIIYCKVFSRNILESVFAELTTKCQIFNPKCIFSTAAVFCALFTMSREP